MKNTIGLLLLTFTLVVSCTQNTPVEKNTKTNNQVSEKGNHLEVYCFHGTRQCTTCKNMKLYTKATLDKYFEKELKSGEIVFSIVDVDDATNEKLAEKFEATGTALMINNVVNGKDSITNLSDFAFEKAHDELQYISELKVMIDEALSYQHGNTLSTH